MLVYVTGVYHGCSLGFDNAMFTVMRYGRGWGLGEMELRVGRNIMIHFLYILLFLI